VRSYSSILIIRALMDEVRSMMDSEKVGKFVARHVPYFVAIKSNKRQASEPSAIRPGTAFEYIFGSSSGG